MSLILGAVVATLLPLLLLQPFVILVLLSLLRGVSVRAVGFVRRAGLNPFAVASLLLDSSFVQSALGGAIVIWPSSTRRSPSPLNQLGGVACAAEDFDDGFELVPDTVPPPKPVVATEVSAPQASCSDAGVVHVWPFGKRYHSDAFCFYGVKGAKKYTTRPNASYPTTLEAALAEQRTPCRSCNRHDA
jgi:hypothetical protein